MFERIHNELHPQLNDDPVRVLEAMIQDLRWKKRLLDAGAIDPIAQVRVPKNPHFLVPEMIELQLRWYRQVAPGVSQRRGANHTPLGETELMLLSKAAIKERLEAWFEQVLERV